MPINANSPTPIDPQPADQLDRLYVRGFSVASTSPGQPVVAAAELVRYSSATGRVGGERLDWRDEDLWTLAQRRPDADAAVDAVLDAMPAIRAASPSATLALLELVAQSIGALAQLPGQQPEPQEQPEEPEQRPEEQPE